MQVRLADFPQLRLIAWNRQEELFVDETEALALYERNWRFVDQTALEPRERDLIDQLVKLHGNGALNV